MEELSELPQGASASLETGPGLCHFVNMMQACLVLHSCGFLFSPAVATRPGLQLRQPSREGVEGGRAAARAEREREFSVLLPLLGSESLQKEKNPACLLHSSSTSPHPSQRKRYFLFPFAIEHTHSPICLSSALESRHQLTAWVNLALGRSWREEAMPRDQMWVRGEALPRSCTG